MSELERIGADVQRELSRFPPVAGMAAIVTAWPAAVGEAIARNAWPARLARDGTLHVATSSSAWAFELTQLAPRLLERLREEIGAEHAPATLRLAPGRLPEPEPARAADGPARVVQANAAATAEGRRLAAEIEDESLRSLIARAAAASLARAADDRSV